MKIILLSLVLFSSSVLATVNLTDYENNIVFYTWNNQGAHINFTFSNNDSFLELCTPQENWTIISHAWMENLQKGQSNIGGPWGQSIVDSFVTFRGGCVMFMDYEYV